MRFPSRSKSGFDSMTDEQKRELGRAADDGMRALRKKLLSPFRKAIDDYGLVARGDKIAVCVSGGKDSFLMAKLFKEYKKHSDTGVKLVFLCMNPGYSDECASGIAQTAAALGISLTMFEAGVFDKAAVEKNPCYACARMRRGLLYEKARALGCNKIALGHHYDDVIETTLISMLYGGQVETMLPKRKSAHYDGMELIRPMYLVRERDIAAWRDGAGLRFARCACPLTENGETEERSKRAAVKRLIAELKADNPYVEQNIFKSMSNVKLASVLGYTDTDGVKHDFWD